MVIWAKWGLRFKKIVDELEGNVEGITLASRGEPTVNRDLPLM